MSQKNQNRGAWVVAGALLLSAVPAGGGISRLVSLAFEEPTRESARF